MSPVTVDQNRPDESDDDDDDDDIIIIEEVSSSAKKSLHKSPLRLDSPPNVGSPHPSQPSLHSIVSTSHVRDLFASNSPTPSPSPPPYEPSVPPNIPGPLPPSDVTLPKISRPQAPSPRSLHQTLSRDHHSPPSAIHRSLPKDSRHSSTNSFDPSSLGDVTLPRVSRPLSPSTSIPRAKKSPPRIDPSPVIASPGSPLRSLQRSSAGNLRHSPPRDAHKLSSSPPRSAHSPPRFSQHSLPENIHNSPPRISRSTPRSSHPSPIRRSEHSPSSFARYDPGATKTLKGVSTTGAFLVTYNRFFLFFFCRICSFARTAHSTDLLYLFHSRVRSLTSSFNGNYRVFFLCVFSVETHPTSRPEVMIDYLEAIALDGAGPLSIDDAEDYFSRFGVLIFCVRADKNDFSVLLSFKDASVYKKVRRVVKLFSCFPLHDCMLLSQSVSRSAHF